MKKFILPILAFSMALPSTSVYAFEETSNSFVENKIVEQNDYVITPQSVNVDVKYGVKRYLATYTENNGKKLNFIMGKITRVSRQVKRLPQAILYQRHIHCQAPLTLK